MPNADFHLEVLKLLLQVAWADGVLDPKEAALLHDLGEKWDVDPRELRDLEAHLASGNGLPQPDMTVLKARSDEAMDAVRKMVMSDGRLELEEVDVLGTIADMLDLKA
ncbi:MAG: TerB family tellurite resistance protein [Myxococcaceae bacterium]